MKWSLTGWFGYGNLGDELMLRVFVEGLKRFDAEAEVMLMVWRDPPTLWLPPETSVRIVSARDRLSVARGLAWADNFLWVGGTCLHRYGFATYDYGLFARLVGTRLYWIGIGADEVGSGLPRAKAQLALATVNGVTFRDSGSQKFAREVWPRVRAEVTEDLVYLLTEEPWFRRPAPASQTCKRFLVSWLEFSPLVDSHPKWADSFARLVPRLVERLGVETFQIASIAGDVDVAANEYLAQAIERVVRSQCPGVEVERCAPTSVPEQLALLQQADFVFSVRLHGILIAKLLATPALGIAYTSKGRFMSEKFDRSLVFQFSDLERDPDAVVAAIAAELERPAKLTLGLDHHVARARRNLEFLQEQCQA